MEKITKNTKPKKTASSSKNEAKQIKITLPRLNLKPGPMAILIILVIIFFFVGTRFNGMIAIGKVGKKPIFAWDVAQTLWQRYRGTALNDLIYENLLIQKAKEVQVTVSQEEIAAEIETITQGVGGQEALNKLLTQRGLSYNEFNRSIKLQVLSKKLIEQEVEITDLEVEAFLNNYGTNLTATDSAGKDTEAREILKDQKVAEISQTYFEDLKDEVGVEYYVEYGQ